MATDPPAPWERQPYDTDASWPVFVEYRDQPTPRKSLGYLVRKGLCSDPIQIARWMETHFWRERVAHYDAHLDGIKTAERDALIKQSVHEITAKQMSILQDIRELCAAEFSKLLLDAKSSALGTVKVRDLIRMLEVGSKLDLLLRGQATERIEEKAPDLSHLSDEQLTQLENMLNGSDAVTPSEDTRH